MIPLKPRELRSRLLLSNMASLYGPVQFPRCSVLRHLFADQLHLGLAQAALTALTAMLVVLFAGRRGIHLEKEVSIAMLRGIVQIVAVGSILALLLRGPRWTSALLLAIMIIAAGRISARRAKDVPGASTVSMWAIAFGAGTVVALMTWLGVIDTAITSLVPVGSMVIANAMTTNSLALNRFRAEVLSHTGEIESALALGADGNASVATCVQDTFEASLIPVIDSIRSLGIVWIPGLMAGMLLSGARPLYASIYQFVVLAMIFTASSLTSLISTLLIRPRIFTPAQ